MKLVEVLASAVVLVLLFQSLSSPLSQIARLKKATTEVRRELYERRELLAASQPNCQGGQHCQGGQLEQ